MQATNGKVVKCRNVIFYTGKGIAIMLIRTDRGWQNMQLWRKYNYLLQCLTYNNAADLQNATKWLDLPKFTEMVYDTGQQNKLGEKYVTENGLTENEKLLLILILKCRL